MLLVILFCVLLIASTTVLHFEMLRVVNRRLPALGIPGRDKMLTVIFAAFVAHAMEIAIYGLTLFLLVRYLDVGTLGGVTDVSFRNCLYFSAETYTSLGFGDLLPMGQIRLLAGTEALNGLLLIGWSVSYAYIAMERFWDIPDRRDRSSK